MPQRTKHDHLTPFELEIMRVLWESGQASVQEVQEHLQRDRSLAYTTVQTMLNILVRKGRARRKLVDRSYRYRPAITEKQFRAGSLKDIVQRMFGGSAEALVLSLVEAKQLTPETLRRLNALVSSEAEDADTE